MKKIAFILLIISSCNNNESQLKTIYFSDIEDIHFFDFDSIENMEAELAFKNYKCKSAKLNTKYGKSSFFLIDINKNNVFSDDDDVLIIGDYNLDSPKNFPKDNKLKNRFLFSINKTIIQFNEIQKVDGKYQGEFQILDEPLNLVKKENRHIDKIPSLDFTDLNGQKITFKSFENKNKLIYIEFWTSWCTPCIQMIPTIKKIHTEFSSDVEIISINADGDRVKPLKYKDIIERYEMNWIQGTTNKDIKETMDFNIYPKGYLFDSTGKLISSDFSPNQLLEYLNEKIKK